MHISDLPYELLSEVFSYVLQHQTPVFLSSVCSTWKDIVWQESHMWSRIIANYENARKGMAMSRYIGLHAQRAARLPLDLSLSISHEVPDKYMPAHAIQSIRDRISRLRIKLPLDSMQELQTLCSPTDPWNLLREASLCAVGDPAFAPSSPPAWPLGSLKALLYAPDLTTLTLSSEPEDSPPSITVPRRRYRPLHLIPFPFDAHIMVSRLHHFHLNRVYITLPLLIDLLRVCPHMQSLTVSFGFSFYSGSHTITDSRPVELPNLVSLRVIIVEGPSMDLDKLAAYIRVPALKEFVVSSRARDEEYSCSNLESRSSFKLHPVLALLNASQCQLESLTLETQMVESVAGTFIRELRRNKSLQSLRSLRVCATGIEGFNLLKFLTYRPVASSAVINQKRLPYLQNVSIGMYHSATEDVPGLGRLAVKMVESRSKDFKEVSLGTVGAFDKQDVQILRGIMNESKISIRLLINEGSRSYL